MSVRQLRTQGNWGYFGRGLDHDPDAASLVAKRITDYRELGWQIRPHWDRHAPLGVVDRDGDWWINTDNALLDHLYRLVTPDGELVYVTEPYWIYDFTDLAALDGWDVLISSTFALLYPGMTIAVHIKKAKA